MEQRLFSKPVTEIKKPATNIFTFSQKKQLKMKEREQPEGANLKSEAYAERLRAEKPSNGISAERRIAAETAWMRKLKEERTLHCCPATLKRLWNAV